MATQYAKRKQKEAAPEATLPVASEASASPDAIAYDLFTPDNGRTFIAVVLSYNLKNNEVAILAHKPVSRKIGLQFQNQKRSLKTLLHIKE